MSDIDINTGLVKERDGRRLVCPRCMVRVGLYKEINPDNTLTILCATCGWHTGKLPRESHHNEKTRDLPDIHDINKKASEFND